MIRLLKLAPPLLPTVNPITLVIWPPVLAITELSLPPAAPTVIPPELMKKVPPPVTTKLLNEFPSAVADCQPGDIAHDPAIHDDQLIADPRSGGAVADVDGARIGEQGIVDR